MQKNSRKKRKPRDSDEETIERLQQELRELKALNRSLMKRLKKVDREYHKAFDEEEVYEAKHKKQNEFDCPQCGKGHLKDNTGIPGRLFRTCTSCDYKSKIERLR